MIRNNRIKKVGFRLLIINIAFFMIKLTVDRGQYAKEGDWLASWFTATSLFYYSSAFILFMLTWETNDWLIRRQLKASKGEGLDISTGLKMLGVTMAIMLPIAAFIYYLGIYVFDDLCKIPPDDKGLRFRIDFFRAALLGLTVIVFNLFYHSMKQKKEVEQKIADLTREMTTSKYNSLKSQISPHFLFNSLNTLTSLMYEDRDLASDFVTRLASSYRYILDNREEDLVSLEKELSFLDSFIFMMNVRHEGAVKITVSIPEEVKHFLIPTLSLQMLVENALKHNYYSKEKPLEIGVFTVGKIGIVVQNTLREREQKEESTKLGIRNIKKRYSFYTNHEVSVEVKNGYFKVTMPLLSDKIKEVKVLSIT